MRLERRDPGGALLGHEVGETIGRVVAHADGFRLPFVDEFEERSDGLGERCLGVVPVRVEQVDDVGLQPAEAFLDATPHGVPRLALEGGLQARLRGDHDLVAVAAVGHPITDDRLGLTADVSFDERRVDVGRVDEVATACGEGIEDREGRLPVGRPPEDIASEAEGKDVDVGVRKAAHRLRVRRRCPAVPHGPHTSRRELA